MKKHADRLFATLFAFAINAAPVTTVILVRHAEKATEPAKDPPLTAEGQARAKALARILGNSGISAIFTTIPAHADRPPRRSRRC